MVFCCTGRVADYDFLIPELKSRLEWGLINTLKEPDLDVRLKCIATMCKEKRVKLSKEQVLTLAQRFTDLRYLQGIITKFFTFRKFVSKTLNDKEFNQILSNAVGETTAGLEPVNIMALVAEHFQLPVKNPHRQQTRPGNSVRQTSGHVSLPQSGGVFLSRPRKTFRRQGSQHGHVRRK